MYNLTLGGSAAWALVVMAARFVRIDVIVSRDVRFRSIHQNFWLASS